MREEILLMKPPTLALGRSVGILLYNVNGATHKLESVPRLLGDEQELLPCSSSGLFPPQS